MRVAGAAIFCAALFCSTSLAALARDDGSLDKPPADLVSSTAKLSAVLALHDKTSSPAAITVVEDWSFTDTGVSGTEHLERSGSNYHSVIHRGPLVEEFGQFNGKRWHQDTNGSSMDTTDIDDRSFVAVRVREDAVDPKNDVAVAGETNGAHPAYVLRVKRPGYQHPEWVFYDESNGNIVRVEYIDGRRRVVETYDDFRTVDGVTQAWHVHDSWPDAVLDDDWRITAFHAGTHVSDASFAAPPSRSTIIPATSRLTIPAQITERGYAIVRVNIGDRGLDFELDPSQQRSYIDRGVAHELQLPTFGHATQFSDGQPLSYETIIPDASVGPIRLHNFSVYASRIAYHPAPGTKVVGVLGYDFLANTELHVDYVHSLIETFAQHDFSGPKPIAGGIDIPLTLDDGVPLVPMEIGDGFTENVVLNSDFDITVVFGPYLNAHSDAFQDMHYDHHEADLPFADDGTFGQKAEFWLTRTPNLRFATANYQQMPIVATNFPYSVSGKNVDAIVGLDYLHFFDLYFDFPHKRLLLVPNSWFYETFKKNA